MTGFSKLVMSGGIMMIATMSLSAPAHADHLHRSVKRNDNSNGCVETFKGWVNDLYGNVCIQNNGDVKLTRSYGNLTHTHIYDASLFDNRYGSHTYRAQKVSYSSHQPGKHKGHHKKGNPHYHKHSGKDDKHDSRREDKGNNFHHTHYDDWQGQNRFYIGWIWD